MKTFTDYLIEYAKYHRDRRNIVTHMIGVPIIVFSVILLLSRPSLEIGAATVTPAHLVCLMTVIFYVRLNAMFGLYMAALFALGIYLANVTISLPLILWLSIGFSLFFIGWVIQFIGHYYEGKKPAFTDDLIGLLIGPLFVLAEVFFAVGMCQQLQKDIEEKAGKVKFNYS